MISPTHSFEDQAAELLRVACATETRSQLLKYASKLCGGDMDTAKECYQQAMLDSHDAIQRRGFAGTREQDYKFYLMRAIKTKHVDEQRRQSGLLPLSEVDLDNLNAMPNPGPSHLAEQVAKEIENHPDRVLLRLSADGHSVRTIGELTGRPKSNVARALGALKESLRLTFSQAWASLD